MSDDALVVIFNTISSFTSDLDEEFSKKHASLKRYSRLISQTSPAYKEANDGQKKLIHETAIRKHIEAFRTFCIENREGLTCKDFSKFASQRISYSDRFYINLYAILKDADQDAKNAIMSHLLVISARVDPGGGAEEVLREHTDEEEEDFISDIMKKLEGHVKTDGSTEPMEVVTSLLQSGVLPEIITGVNEKMKDGSLNFATIVSSVQKLTKRMSKEAGNEGEQAMNVVNSIMSNMQGNNSSEGGPDMGSILGALGPMLGGMGGNGGLAGMMGGEGTIEEQIEAQLQSARDAGEFVSSSGEDEID
jgi:hypothetical protein